MKRTSTRINMIFYAWIMIAIYSDLRMYGLSADVTLQCPEKFKDSELNNISCEINSAAGSCGANIVSISIQRSGSSTPVPLCNPDAAYPCTAAAPVPTQNGQCACTKLDGNKFTYTLAYQANYATDRGAKIVCQVCPGSPSTISNCDSIKYVDGCDSAPCKHGRPCNATSATEYTCDCTPFWDQPNCEESPCSKEKRDGLIAGMVIGGVVLIVGIIFIIWWFLEEKKKQWKLILSVVLVVVGAAGLIGCGAAFGVIQLGGNQLGSNEPGKPLNLRNDGITVTSVTLKWDAPLDGNPPFTYLVQYRPNGQEMWWVNNPGNSSGTTVTQLKVDTEYEFRVRARADYEEGEFTDIINATTAGSP